VSIAKVPGEVLQLQGMRKRGVSEQAANLVSLQREQKRVPRKAGKTPMMADQGGTWPTNKSRGNGSAKKNKKNAQNQQNPQQNKYGPPAKRGEATPSYVKKEKKRRT